MADRTPIVSPQNSHDAADALDRLAVRLEQARDVAEKHATLRDKFEAMYRAASARATMDDAVLSLKSEDRRRAAVQDYPLTVDARSDGGKLAETMGLAGTTPLTCGDLKWLAARAASLAESHAAKAYDARQVIGAWQVVAAMARHEMELGKIGRVA